MSVKTHLGRLGLAALATAVLALAGCSSSGQHGTSGHTGAPAPSVSAGSTHNDADITFAQGMIPHHQQAVRMAELAATRAVDPQVAQLATQIKTAQGPEIELMTGWLTAWGQPTAMPGHDMGNMAAMPGMMTDEQMAALEAMSGAAFDREFVAMMIAHHQGAVTMAKTEQAEGSDPAAKELAAKIEKDQTAEIAMLQQIKDRLK
ncbi:DUF305 domain-containing protein [Catellatospora chokoriensis]|nr:DUF305 domain-containing protein [Catellatospora chokoriensis]